MKVVVTALLAAVIAVGCSDANPVPPDVAASSTSTPPSTDTVAATTSADLGALVAIEEPTTPLFMDERNEIWARAWAELDIDVIADFFAENAIFNGTLLGKALVEAQVRHPDPMQWEEIHQDCVHHNDQYVTCDVRWTSAVHRPAGLEVPVQRTVIFDDTGMISLYRDDVRFDTVIEFEIAIAEWLADKHPEIAPVDWETDDHERYAETVRGVLAVVDEFVAWSDAYPPAPRIVEEPELIGTIDGVDVYNANDDQLALVAWALDRFAASGLDLPPVTHVVFPPTAACEQGFSGMSFHTDAEGHIDVCTAPETFAATSGAAPLTARRTILHELGHLWTIVNTDESSRAAFVSHLGLEAWTGVEWEVSGSEMAAEILMWGLIDEEVGVRVPGATCDDRMAAFLLLTGTSPPMRSCTGA